jgi:hypothetical protein
LAGFIEAVLKEVPFTTTINLMKYVPRFTKVIGSATANPL